MRLCDLALKWLEKNHGHKAGQTNATSMGVLIPNGSLREASEPAPGYSAFLEKKILSKWSHTFPDID